MRVNLNQNSLSLFLSWTPWSSVPHEFVTRPQSLYCNFETCSLRKICWCQSLGYPAKADRKEVDVLYGEGVDCWLEGFQEGGQMEQTGLNKCHHWHDYHNHDYHLHPTRLITNQQDGSVSISQWQKPKIKSVTINLSRQHVKFTIHNVNLLEPIKLVKLVSLWKIVNQFYWNQWN